MYVPPHFAEDDPAILHDLIRDHSFGLLVSVVDGAPFATHLPFLLDAERGPHGTLVAHMARANPHWRAFADGGDSLVVFQGPHAYVTPSWYAPGNNVPTWNYVAVHAYGVARVIDDPAATRAVPERLTALHESGFAEPWQLADQDPKFIDGMVRGIVAFELPVARLEGKAKLSQNKPPADRAAVAAALAACDRADDQALAAMMAARQQAPANGG
jgi:transcriptional regulator